MPDDIVEIRCFHPDRASSFKPKQFWIKAHEVPGKYSDLAMLNAQGYGIYAGVMPRTESGLGKDEHCLPCKCLWADFDGEGMEDPRLPYKIIKDKNFPVPSVVVESGHGTHFYWIMSGRVEADKIHTVVGGISELFNSDKSVKNPSRVMRLPGFENTKYQKLENTLLRYYDDKAIYDIDQITSHLPRKQPESHFKSNQVPEVGSDVLGRAKAYLAKMEGASEGGRTTKLYRVACKLVSDANIDDETAARLMLGWDMQNNFPPVQSDEKYGVDEFYKIIGNAHKYHKKQSGSFFEDDNIRPIANIDCDEIDSDIVDDILDTVEKERTGEIRKVKINGLSRLCDMTGFGIEGSLTILSGGPGSGKSFMSLAIGMGYQEAGETWRYLPLEKDRQFHVRRMAAMVTGSFSVINGEQYDAEEAKSLISRNRHIISETAKNIADNPAIGNGEYSEVNYKSIIDWCKRYAETTRLLIVDPFASIDFDHKKEFEEHSKLIRKLNAIASNTKCNIILVIHTIKKTEGRITLGDVEGSKKLTQLADSVMLMQPVERDEFTVKISGGGKTEKHANKKMHLLKTRNGSGEGQVLAYDFGYPSPTFKEQGIVTKG